MDSLLYELYNGDYEIGTYLGKDEKKILKEIEPILDKVKAEFGLELVDRLSRSYADQRALSNYRHYREGFRLGARLMLEALTEESATE